MTITEALKLSNWIKKKSSKYFYVCLIGNFLYSGDTRIYGIKSKFKVDYEDLISMDWETCSKDVKKIGEKEYSEYLKHKQREEGLIPIVVYKAHPVLNGQ